MVHQFFERLFGLWWGNFRLVLLFLRSQAFFNILYKSHWEALFRHKSVSYWKSAPSTRCTSKNGENRARRQVCVWNSAIGCFQIKCVWHLIFIWNSLSCFRFIWLAYRRLTFFRLSFRIWNFFHHASSWACSICFACLSAFLSFLGILSAATIAVRFDEAWKAKSHHAQSQFLGDRKRAWIEHIRNKLGGLE